MPRLCILVIHHCVKERYEAFKSCVTYQDVLCRFEYAEQVVERFEKQVQFAYYNENKSFFIVGIALYQFSDPHQPSPFFASVNFSRRAVIHSYLSEVRKQDSAITATHSKQII